jgi:hypothetical protein
MNIQTLEQQVLTGHNPGHKDGFMTEALFKCPKALAFACDGRILIVSDGNACLRCIDFENGQVTTLAGQVGKPGCNRIGEIYKLSEVQFMSISKIFVSKVSPGTVYITDAG